MHKIAPFISIIICTYNNTERLKNALNSLLNLTSVEDKNYEIILINNNSSDDTENTAKSISPLFLGRLRYYFEKSQGLSYARNRGIKEAKGDYVTFIDDDCTVEKNWLNELNKCIKLHNPDIIGGKILLYWETKKPRWLTENLRANLGLLDYGDKPFRITSHDNQIVGANFTVRKAIFENQKYLFKVQLGRQGKKLFSAEETELFFNLFHDGYQLWYWPASCAYHHIPKSKTTISYFLKWYFYYGQTIGYLQKLCPQVLSYNGNSILRHRLKILIRCLKTIDKSYVELITFFARYLGIAVYYLKR